MEKENKEQLTAEGRIAQLEAELALEREQKEKLKSQLDIAEKPNSVQGTYTRTKTAEGSGKKEKKVYRFKDGAHLTRIAGGTTIPTVELLKLGSDPEYVVDEETLGSYPSLVDFTHAEAVERLDSLIDMKYGLIEEVK